MIPQLTPILGDIFDPDTTAILIAVEAQQNPNSGHFSPRPNIQVPMPGERSSVACPEGSSFDTSKGVDGADTMKIGLVWSMVVSGSRKRW